MSRTRSLLPVVLVLAVALAVFAAPGRQVHAGNAAFVDAAGACAGQTPCFTTVQAAVEGSPNAPNFISIFSGTYNENVDLDAATFDVTLRAVDTDLAYAPGTVIIAGTHPLQGMDRMSPTEILGLVFESSVGDCVRIASQSAITVEDSTGNECGDGLDGGDRTGDDGFDLKTSGAGGVTVNNVLASGNAGIYADGIEITSGGPVSVTETTANNNTGPSDAGGVDIYDTTGVVTLVDVTAIGNSDDGVYVDTTKSVTLTDVTTTGNGDDGVLVITAVNLDASGVASTGNSDDGLYTESGGNSAVADSVFTENADEGAELHAVNIEVNNAIASDNGEHGLRLSAAEGVTVDRVTATGNGFALPGQRDGMFITSPNVPSFFRVAGLPIANLSVLNSLVAGNGGAAIKVENLAPAGAHVIESTVMCNNPEGGVSLYAPGATVDARANWWGVASGPTHPNNPGGTGEIIYDDPNGTFGDVTYDPWLGVGEVSVPAEVFAGQANELGTVFKSANGVYTLGEGPGADLAALPFQVSTLEGTVMTDEGGTAPAVGGYFAGGTLDFAWMPDVAGPGEVVVQGPCTMAALVSADIQEGGLPVAWGDNNCSGAADPIDALLELRYDGGLPTETGDCPEMGAGVLVSDAVPAGGFPPLTWGDVDCSGAANPVDSLKLLRFDAGLSVAQEPECPLLGASVLVSDLPPP